MTSRKEISFFFAKCRHYDKVMFEGKNKKKSLIYVTERVDLGWKWSLEPVTSNTTHKNLNGFKIQRTPRVSACKAMWNSTPGQRT